jgi:dTDP-4-dehydrorhamnose 3,5-epimerase
MQENRICFIFQKVFAHGFYVLSDEAIFTYKCTDFYDLKGEGGLMWNDPAIAIDWKSVALYVNPLLSEKDQKHPAFYKTKRYFDKNGKWIGEL